MLNFISTVIIGYLLGCIQSSFFISKFIYSFDIRTRGSGNAGASNMVVSLGWKYGFITGFLDVLKSASAIWIITYLYPNSDHLISLQYLAGCSAILGHIFPFFMGFMGGKGMACFLGMLLGINFIFGLKCMVALMLTTMLTSYVALGSIIAYGALPIWGSLSGSMTPDTVVLTSLIGVLGIFKHRNNISNMIQGTEIGFWQVVFNKHKQVK